MGDDFKGWRRKLGLVTLALAYIVMGAWVRSGMMLDVVTCRCFGMSSTFIPVRGEIHWMRSAQLTDDPCLDWKSYDAPRWPVKLWAYFDPVWEREVVGIKVVSGQYRDTGNTSHFGVIPYWSVVCPLTLTSLWLLIPRPDRLMQKRLSEPTAGKVV